MNKEYPAAVVISDLHCGSRLAIMPPHFQIQGASPKEMLTITPSPFQRWLLQCWHEFWNGFVPEATRGDPYVIIVNGDAVEGRHHTEEKLITSNTIEQTQMVLDLLLPVVQNRSCARLMFTAGTEAHCGIENVFTEMISRQFKSSRVDPQVYQEIYLRIGGKGRKKAILHITHTTGTTGVSAYESTAPVRELVEMQVQSARWGMPLPQFTIRSHRHRQIGISIPGLYGPSWAITTPGWVGKPPYVFRSLGGRVNPPQVGGIVIRAGEHEVYPRFFTRSPGWEEEV